ncbi:hypothetical protein SteCoe_24454 [Stentor coeruleus]|uniref:Uncharacterized protein n=1 Tax=Stentor coeruleus TaxID=5963 RepID=A0A1R2BHI8_9CILI|nr:hypothetical protein SteCoe_24454 [Stentor coeruleus]
MGCTSLKSTSIHSIEKVGVKYKVTYTDKSVYMGEFNSRKREGFGYYHFNKNQEYHGMWVNDLRNGEGESTFSNKNYYKGNWVNNHMSGQGMMIYKNLCSTYTGQWELSKPHGQGVYEIQGPVRIEGTWRQGILEGQGKVLWENTWSITGKFVRNHLMKQVQIEGPDVSGQYFEKFDIELPIIGRAFFSKELPLKIYAGQMEGVFIINGIDIYKGVIKYKPQSMMQIIDDPVDFENIETFAQDIEGQGVYYWPDGRFIKGNWKCIFSIGENEHIEKGYNGDWVSGIKKTDWETVFVLDGKGIMYIPEVSKYEGLWNMGIKQGYGVMTWLDTGKKYSGQWKNDKFHGFGILSDEHNKNFEGFFENGNFISGKIIWTDGNIFIGKCINSIKTIGKWEYPNGDKYEGHLQNSQRSGKGMMFWSNGDIYKGDWVQNLPQGRGIYINSTGEIYTGSFIKGKRHGLGCLSSEPNIVYIWKNGIKVKAHGEENIKEIYDNAGMTIEREKNTCHSDKNLDLYVFPLSETEEIRNGILWKFNGEVYEGQFDMLKVKGKGIYKKNNGTCYIGDFNWEVIMRNTGQDDDETREDKLWGTGEIQFGNGCVIKGKWENWNIVKDAECWFPDGRFYTGELVDNLPNGRGKMIYVTGEFYEGEFLDGKKQGHGRHVEKDETFSGMWNNDKKHGVGISVDSSSSEYAGMWKKNKKHGPCTITLSNNDRFICEFINDELLEPGTLITSEGSHESKLWRDGKLVDYEKCQSFSL